MLEIRPTCEHCNTPLDPLADDARICTYECTFCARCATWELLGVCPNCGGELVARPRRPADKLRKDPPSTTVRHRPVDLGAHCEIVERRLRDGDLPAQVWTVAFCNGRPDGDGDDSDDGYGTTAAAMDALAGTQPGFIGVDAVRSVGGAGITVSRWSSIAAMVSWRHIAAHREAQHEGRERWYDWYRLDVARVDRTSDFRREGTSDR